jgi:hypothetical protein
MNTHALRSTRTDTRPWYREPWPWLLMAGPAVVVVAGFVTLYLAWSTDDGVIAEDYYKQGLLINKQLTRVARAEALGLGAVARIAPDGAIRVTLSGSGGAVAMPATLRVRFVHPTRAGHDRNAVLTQEADGSYAGWIEPLPFAHWHVTVEADAWELPTAATNGALGEVRLGASRQPG